MRWLRGALTGALALTFLEVLVTNDRAAGGVTGAAGWLSRGVARFLDPAAPGIYDHSPILASDPAAIAITPAGASRRSA